MVIKLAKEREKRGLTQYDLAIMTGIHPSDISRLESGKFPCFNGWEKHIIQALNWPVERTEELFREE